MTLVLVTGAAGFIGSHLCESLLGLGCAVRGYDAFTTFYDPARKRDNLAASMRHERFELLTGDLVEDALEEALDGVDAVAHLAGEPGVTTSWGPSFDRYLRRNVLATQRLLEAVCSSSVERLVYASSSSVYGPRASALRGGEPRPASPYGASKLAAETLVAAYAQTRHVPAVSLRYFSVYGPRQRPDMAAHRFIEALLDGRPLEVYGDGRQARDFTYVADVVQATVSALFADLPPGSVFDIASERPTTVRELLEALGDLVGAPEVHLSRQQERPGDVPRTEGSIDAARRQLRWTPATELRTGLANQVLWHVDRRRTTAAEGFRPADGAGLLPTAGG